MLTLYGIPRSRALRCIWMLEEIGQPYQMDPISPYDETSKTPEYMEINPFGRVPTLRDGDFIIWESLAINNYLAEVYGGPLWPGTPQDRGRLFQWSHFIMNDVERPATQALFHSFLLPEEQRDPGQVREAAEALQKPLGVLDKGLAGRSCLIGDAFSVADLNVVSVLTWVLRAGVDLSAFPHIGPWARECMGRPAAQKAFATIKG